jgi:hypothetical protein
MSQVEKKKKVKGKKERKKKKLSQFGDPYPGLSTLMSPTLQLYCDRPEA